MVQIRKCGRMNKYQDSLDNFVKALSHFTNFKSIHDWKSDLQELIDMATPKAPNFEHSGHRSPDGTSVIMFFKYNCPCCKSRISGIDKFCPECGQAIERSL